MPLRLSRVTSTTDFEEITRVQFLAYRDPWIPLLQLFFPVADSSPDAYEAAIKDATRRITEWHQSDPTSTWLKVTDDATGRIAGAACWHMYDHDPYTTYPDIDCYWWPKGEDRKVANALMRQFLEARRTYMRRPHMCMKPVFSAFGQKEGQVPLTCCQF